MDRQTLYYEVTRERLQSQESLSAEFGTKAIGILGIGIAILTAGSIILRFSDEPLRFGEAVLWIFAILVVVFIAVVYKCVQLLRPRDWSRGPNLDTLSEYLLVDYSSEVLTDWVGDNYKDSVKENKEILRLKAYDLLHSVAFLVAEAVMLAPLAVLCCWPS